MDASRVNNNLENIMSMIAHITDMHIGDEFSDHYKVDSKHNFISILNDIVARRIENVAITGDCGDSEKISWMINELNIRGLKYFISLGNHDSIEDYKNIDQFKFRLLKDKLFYIYEFDGIKMIVLDTSKTRIGLFQMEKLRNLLNKHAYTLIFCHHPILDCGNTVMDIKFPLKDRKSVYKVLVNKKISIFCGHYHNEYKVQTNNIFQYVTPSASIQLKKYGEKLINDGIKYGYRLIQIENGKIDTNVIWFE